ncbi:MAG: 30S ribosome-binding factor RbfA [Nitrospirota bacterium]|nr:30S ribosome-binding factor RbfA [Nitrospirota bacterium]
MTSGHGADYLRKKGYRRHTRVADTLREVIAEAVERRLDVLGDGLVTITGVDAAPDLKTARVSVSVLGGDIDAAVKGLNEAAPRIQSEIANTMRMKWTPRLTFTGDDTPERADRIGRLLSDTTPEEEH